MSDPFTPSPFPDPAPSPPPPTRAIDPTATPDDRTYTLFIHLMLPIATFTVLPLVLGPLTMWLIRKRESTFIDDHGKEALNFHLTTLLYYALSAVLGLITCGVGWFAVPIVWAFTNAFSVVAAIAANRGELYRYPACIRLIT